MRSSDHITLGPWRLLPAPCSLLPAPCSPPAVTPLHSAHLVSDSYRIPANPHADTEPSLVTLRAPLSRPELQGPFDEMYGSYDLLILCIYHARHSHVGLFICM